MFMGHLLRLTNYVYVQPEPPNFKTISALSFTPEESLREMGLTD